MLINLKLATHAFRCGSQHWKFGVQNNLVQSIRSQMTQSNVFTKNAIPNQQSRNVSDKQILIIEDDLLFIRMCFNTK